jgi:hypothetical protein
MPTKGPRRISVPRNTISKQKSAHPGIIMKAPPFDAHPARFSALPTRFSRVTPVDREWRVPKRVGGGFPELAEPRLVDRAEPRANAREAALTF